MSSFSTPVKITIEEWALELLDNQPEPVVLYLPVWSEIETPHTIIDFEVAYLNLEATKNFAFNKGELLSQQVFTHSYTDSTVKALWFNLLLQVFQTGEKAEKRYYHTASKRHFTIICTKVKEGVLTVARDITREVEAKKEKERHASFVTGILNATINGLFALEAIRNEDGKIIDFSFVKANEQFAKLVGKKEAEIIGKSYTTLLPLSKANGLFDLKCQVIETGETIIKEFYYEGGGIDKWYLIAITKLGEDGIVETFTDITESKRDKEEVALLAERFRTVINMSQSGFMTFRPIEDENGEIVDFRFNIVNQATAAYIGQTADVLTGSVASMYFPAYKSNGLFEIYKACYITGITQHFDFHYEDGYDVFFNLQVVKMDNEVLVTLTDHTTLKRTQRELETSIAELKRSNTSLEQFAHAASHDLQEPLRKISLYSNRLEEKHADELSDEAFGHLERIQTASKRMQRLIQDLLVFAEVGANRPEMEEVDLNALLQDVLNDLEVALNERDAVVTIQDVGKVKGDSLHLQQLFQNLISNSLKYSRSEVVPQITIKATTITGKESGLVLQEHEADKSFWQLQVQDNGQGFTEEQAGHIFKIFQRLPQHRHQYTGTGIGLAIVQRVVENHKGYIKATGVPGEGATFTILLPV